MWSTLLVISVIVCASEGFEYYINIVGCVNKTVDLKCDGGMQYLMINNGMLWGVADLMNGNTCLKSRVNCTEHQMSNGLIVKAQSLCNNERRCQFTVPSKMLDECGAESNFINMRAQCLATKSAPNVTLLIPTHVVIGSPSNETPITANDNEDTVTSDNPSTMSGSTAGSMVGTRNPNTPVMDRTGTTSRTTLTSKASWNNTDQDVITSSPMYTTPPVAGLTSLPTVVSTGSLARTSEGAFGGEHTTVPLDNIGSYSSPTGGVTLTPTAEQNGDASHQTTSSNSETEQQTSESTRLTTPSDFTINGSKSTNSAENTSNDTANGVDDPGGTTQPGNQQYLTTQPVDATVDVTTKLHTEMGTLPNSGSSYSMAKSDVITTPSVSQTTGGKPHSERVPEGTTQFNIEQTSGQSVTQPVGNTQEIVTRQFNSTEQAVGTTTPQLDSVTESSGPTHSPGVTWRTIGSHSTKALWTGIPHSKNRPSPVTDKTTTPGNDVSVENSSAPEAGTSTLEGGGPTTAETTDDIGVASQQLLSTTSSYSTVKTGDTSNTQLPDWNTTASKSDKSTDSNSGSSLTGSTPAEPNSTKETESRPTAHVPHSSSTPPTSSVITRNNSHPNDDGPTTAETRSTKTAEVTRVTSLQLLTTTSSYSTVKIGDTAATRNREISTTATTGTIGGEQVTRRIGDTSQSVDGELDGTTTKVNTTERTRSQSSTIAYASKATISDGDTVSPTTLATSSTDSTTTETPDTNATQDTTTVVETTTNVIIVGTPDMGIKAETAVQLNSGSLEWWIYVVIALGIVMVLVISGLGVALIYYRRKVHRYFATKALRKHREITHPPAYRPESAFDNIITDHEVSFNESMPGVEEIAAPQNDCPDEVSTGYLISLGSSTTDSDSPNSTLSAAPSQVVLQEIRTEL